MYSSGDEEELHSYINFERRKNSGVELRLESAV